MTEIPVGSPTPPPGRHAAPPGWYADPSVTGSERYWDGWQWSRQTRPSGPARIPAEGGRAGGNASASAHAARGAGWDRTDPATVLAAPGARVGAMMIDAVILGTLSAICCYPMLAELSRAIVAAGPAPGEAVVRSLTNRAGVVGTVCNLVSALISTCYGLFFLRWTGATIGQQIVGVRVVSRRGEPLNWAAAFIRGVAWSIAANTFPLLLLNCLYGFANREWSTLVDEVARTRVVDRVRFDARQARRSPPAVVVAGEPSGQPQWPAPQVPDPSPDGHELLAPPPPGRRYFPPTDERATGRVIGDD